MAAAMSASLCAASVASGLAHGAETGGILQCRMRVPSQVAAGQAIPLTFELVSRSYKTLYILPWNTPLEGWFGSYLRVKGTNGEVPYRGPQAKRAAPEHGDYVRIRAGKSVSATVDLAQVYALAPGTYQVAFNGSLHDVTDKPPASRRTPAFVDCPAATFEVVP